MSLLPVKKMNTPYGFFGYEGMVVDIAMFKDDGAMLQECIDKGYVDAKCRMVGFSSVLDYCVARGKANCADVFRKNLAAA